MGGENTYASGPGPVDPPSDIAAVISARGLVGLASDAKWDHFVDTIRMREGWRPDYRYKCVDGPASEWDNEWFYHLPFPLVSVEWMDLAFWERRHEPRGRHVVITDQSPWLEAALRAAGLDHSKGAGMIRIFGYSPRRGDFFDDLGAGAACP